MSKIVFQKILITILLLIALVVLLMISKVVILPFILALILSFLLMPVVKLLEKIKIPAGIGMVLIYLLLFLMTAVLVYWGLPRVLQEIAAISIALKEYLAVLEVMAIEWLEKMKMALGITAISPEILNIIDKVYGNIQTDFSNWVGRSLGVLPSFFSNLTIIILAPVMSYYLVVDRQDFSKRLGALLPPHFRTALSPLISDINSVIRNFIKGYVLVAILVGLLFYILLLIFGIDYALTLGVIMAIAELIPYFGPYLAFVPSVLLVLLQEPTAVVKLIVIWLVVQQVENMVISPKIMGNSVYLHPLAVMLAVLISGYWFGILGMILSVPVAAVIKLIITWAYNLIISNREKQKPQNLL